MRAILLALLVASSAAATQAADRQIKFAGEVCDYTARFDPAKWSEARVRAALEATYRAPSTPFGGMYDGAESVSKFDLAAYRKECAAAIATAEATETLGVPEMESYKAARVAEVRDICAFGEIRHRIAMGEGAAVRDYAPAAGKCNRFGDALEGKADMDAAFRLTVEESCRNNSNVRRCRADAEALRAKPDGPVRVRLHVLEFGWNNCAINYRKDDAGKLLERARKRLDAVLKVRALPCQP